jgi:hypothetical protein
MRAFWKIQEINPSEENRRPNWRETWLLEMSTSQFFWDPIKKLIVWAVDQYSEFL